MHELDIYKERIRDNICFIIEDVVGKTTIFASEIQENEKNVGKWKRGESIPSVLQLIKIADWYGVTLDDMVRKDLKHFSTDMSHKLTTDYISGVSEMIRNALTGDEYVWSVLLKESPALKKEIDKRIEDQIRCRSDLELAEKLEEEGNLDDAWPLYEGCARNYHEIKGVWGAIRCIRKKQDILSTEWRKTKNESLIFKCEELDTAVLSIKEWMIVNILGKSNPASMVNLRWRDEYRNKVWRITVKF